MEIKRSDTIDNEFYKIRSSAYIEKYADVIYKLNSISDIVGKLYDIFDKHLSDEAKNFTIEYGKKKYEFFYPTTKQEFRNLKRLRKYFINKVLADTIYGATKDPERAENFHNFLALMLLGEDPKDHQMEQIPVEELISEIEAGIGTNESGRKGLPLDLESYQVRSNMQDKALAILEPLGDGKDEENEGCDCRVCTIHRMGFYVTRDKSPMYLPPIYCGDVEDCNCNECLAPYQKCENLKENKEHLDRKNKNGSYKLE